MCLCGAAERAPSMGSHPGEAEHHFLLPDSELLSNVRNQILGGIAFSASYEWMCNFGDEWVQSCFMSLYSSLFMNPYFLPCFHFLFSFYFLFNTAFFLFLLSPSFHFFCFHLPFLLLASQLFITVIFFPSHWTLDVVLIDRRGLKAHSKAPVFLNRLLSHQKMYSNIPLEHIIWK